MASIQRKQSFSKEELRRAREALDKIFPPFEKMTEDEKRECDQLIKSNQMLI